MTGSIPLVVELDRGLARGDRRWESRVGRVLRRPWRSLIPRPSGVPDPGEAGGQGRRESEEVRRADLNEDVLELVEARRRDGGRVILVSWSEYHGLEQLAEDVGVEALRIGAAADADRRREVLQTRLGSFDYVGGTSRALPVWRAARRAFAVNVRPSVLRSAREEGVEIEVVAERQDLLAAFLRAIRPHQWAKNSLLVLPALAAHLPPSAGLAMRLTLGFFAFSLLASAVYLLNDLADLREDRLHPVRRHRPLASGALPVPVALGGVVALAGGAAILSVALPPAFRQILAAYLVLTTAYSMGLKRTAVLDVIVLATLYAARVVGGAALAEVGLSRWFIAFSVFFFFSLALVKRLVELRGLPDDLTPDTTRRGYLPEDVPVVLALGGGAIAASSLVYCQYILGPTVAELYTTPDVLWFGLPLVLYWQARIWFLGHRGRVDQDPVVFALRDRVSYGVVLAFLVVVWIAA